MAELEFHAKEADPFDFALALELGMTVHEMHVRMPHAEYVRWRAFFNYRAAMAELEAKKKGRRRG